MNDEPEVTDVFQEIELPPTADTELLRVTVDGFEGPLDLLLKLARDQKVDLCKISVLKLAEQYLDFIESAKRMNLELAADYLVMAAWLAYLKSRLVLPQPHEDDDEPDAIEMAARLRWRLQRLEAMREAASRLMARDRLGRDVFGRGAPEPVKVVRLRAYTDSLYDLLSAYAGGRVKAMKRATYQPLQQPIVLIEEARNRLERMLGAIPNWNGLQTLLPFEWSGGLRRRSALASTLLACLELCRDGRLDLQQMAPFAEIYVRDHKGGAIS